MNIKLIQPTNYKSLKTGEMYIFESFFEEESRCNGILLKVSTKWRIIKDEKGKVTGKELVGDKVNFIPEDNTTTWKPTGEVLEIYSRTVTNGLFRIFTKE